MIIAPRIIAVDNEADDLLALERAFDGLGGLCECIDFDRANQRTAPFVTGVRILFMDINLMPGAGGNAGARNFAPISAIISKIIGAENGPYALITWTKDTAAHDALVAYLETNLAEPLRPCANYCLPKDGHLEDPVALIAKLTTLQSEIPGLAMLLDWEKAVMKAADRSVHQIAQLSNAYGLKQGLAVAQSVHAISHAAAGRTEADANPFRAFTQGMSALLADQLDKAGADKSTADAWKASLAAQPIAEPNDTQRAALNTFFHLEPPDANSSPTFGTIYKISFNAIKPFLKSRFATHDEAMIGNEFLPMKESRNKGNDPQFAQSCEWRLIQLGAACDHANGKVQVLDGMLAVEVPESCFEATNLGSRKNGKTKFGDTPGGLEWLFQTPPFLRDGVRYVLVANMRFRISLPKDKMKKLKRAGALRDALATEIAIHAANFSTRPGTIEFR
ncbi:MAG: hypothetical protein ACKVOJ_12010 [Sphingomonadaceae bacterium]